MSAKKTLKKKSSTKAKSEQLKKMSAGELMNDQNLRKTIVKRLMSQPETKKLIIKLVLAKLA
jgi:hypothetical protein